MIIKNKFCIENHKNLKQQRLFEANNINSELKLNHFIHTKNIDGLT